MRDCYAGNFLLDGEILELPSVNRDKYNIEDIREAVDHHDKYSLETCSYKEREVYMEISSHRADLQKKYEEAVASTGTLHKYERIEDAVKCLQACYHNKHFNVFHDPVFPCEICKYPECPPLKCTAFLNCMMHFAVMTKICGGFINILIMDLGLTS